MVKDRIISGLICEFNPLHRGHRYIIDRIKAETAGPLVCVMSGNFVQRGQCAIIDKWSRAEMALKNGADLVLELPLPYAVAGAEKFARGGIQILAGLNSVDKIFFGSECGDTEKLRQISEFLLSDEFSEKIKESANGALTFASARKTLVESSLGREYGEIISQSNNILAIEYIKALINSGSEIEPMAIKRIGAGHDEATDGAITSASHIRSMIYNKSHVEKLMPRESYEILKKALDTGIYPAATENLTRAILCHLRTTGADRLKKAPDVGEGIENKIISAAGRCGTLQALYDEIKSKRYSHARIRRIILSSFLGITGDEAIEYIRVLGMNKNGEEIIRAAKPAIPLVFTYSDVKKLGEAAMELFRLESAADDIYALMTKKIMDSGKNYTTKLIKL